MRPRGKYIPPDQVAVYREQIEKLQHRPEKYVQQHCSTILGELDESDYTSDSERETVHSNQSPTRQEGGMSASSDAKDETVGKGSLGDLREEAKKDQSITSDLSESVCLAEV